MFSGSLAKRKRMPRYELSPAQFEDLLRTISRISLILLGIFALVLALRAAHAILAPVALAIIIGLVFGPVAERLEARGIPAPISAAMVVLGLILLIATSIFLFAVPLSDWVARIPQIWAKAQDELRNWQSQLQAIAAMQDELQGALTSDTAVEVTVADGNNVVDVALLAPVIIGDILIFLVSLYFYLATRDNIRNAVLSLVISRRTRWRAAHVFTDVEAKVSRFLLSVTLLNIGVGVAVTIMTWALGLPTPLLWGVLAAILNYIPYVGQATMVAILLAVGFATQPDLPHILMPVGVYLLINLIEGHMIFPQFVGHQMTINPFLVFLSIVFWIWLWGPFGSLFAVPSLLILQSTISNVLPGKEVKPRRPVRRTADMTEKDVVLANAAQVIKEQAEEEAAVLAEAEAAKHEADSAKHEAKSAKREADEAKHEADEAKHEAEDARKEARRAKDEVEAVVDEVTKGDAAVVRRRGAPKGPVTAA